MYFPVSEPKTLTELLFGLEVMRMDAEHCVGVGVNLADAVAPLVVSTVPVCSLYEMADTTTVEVIVNMTITNIKIAFLIFFI